LRERVEIERGDRDRREREERERGDRVERTKSPLIQTQCVCV
jgi:hypothetical protein